MFKKWIVFLFLFSHLCNKSKMEQTDDERLFTFIIVVFSSKWQIQTQMHQWHTDSPCFKKMYFAEERHSRS